MPYNIGLPMIYPANETAFTGGGYGALPDGTYCNVTEVINGSFELEMQYPINGNNFSRIKKNNIIACMPNPYDAVAYFRIYRISRPIDGLVTVYGEHIHYLVNGYVCKPNTEYVESGSSCGTFMTMLEEQCAAAATAMGSLAFTFSTDIQTTEKWSIENPVTVEDAMKYAVEVFGGEWHYEGLNCHLAERRGEDRHVQVRYGSNMTGITAEEADGNYSHLMPYYSDGEEFVYASGDYVAVPGFDMSTKHKKAKIIDFSGEFEEKPTESELEDKATEYIAKEKPKQNQNNIKVSFVPRGMTVEYAHLYDIDHVELGDDITASADIIGVNETSRCNKITYDVYTNLYTVAELGEVLPSTLNESVRAAIKGTTNNNPVWYSDDHQPTENIKSGDFWIKIDDDVNRNAQQLAEYKGGQWKLHCAFPTGGGGGSFDPIISPTAPVIINLSTGDFIIKTASGDLTTVTGLQIYTASGTWQSITNYQYGSSPSGIDPSASDGLYFIVVASGQPRAIIRAENGAWSTKAYESGTSGSFNQFFLNTVPTSEASNGDWWIQIDNTTSKKASACYKAISNAWVLMFNFGGDSGVTIANAILVRPEDIT